MATVTQHAPGTFCWPELATADAQGAKQFYTTLFGWTANDNDMGDGTFYTMLLLHGQPVGALYPLNKDQASQGVPPNWGSYVAVESADDAATRARTLGGQVIMEPFDVMEHGRMAVIRDPQGAVFSVWQARKHIGAHILDEVGALCWTELMTTDTRSAEKFYTGLFPWKGQPMPMASGQTYTVFKRGEANAAGMMQIVPEMGPVPPNWSVYFQVADCDASATKAVSLGAKTIMPPTDIPNIGRFAVLLDPQGAPFAIFKL